MSNDNTIIKKSNCERFVEGYKTDSDAVYELLGFVQNLYNFDEAVTFVRLYVKSINEAVELTGKGNVLNLSNIIHKIAEIDERFCGADER